MDAVCVIWFSAFWPLRLGTLQIRSNKITSMNTQHILHTYLHCSLRSWNPSTPFPSTVSSARNQHPGQVTTTLQEHQMTLLRCHEDLRQHHQNEKSILQELQVGPIGGRWGSGDGNLKKFEMKIADVVGLVLFYVLSKTVMNAWESQSPLRPWVGPMLILDGTYAFAASQIIALFVSLRLNQMPLRCHYCDPSGSFGIFQIYSEDEHFSTDEVTCHDYPWLPWPFCAWPLWRKEKKEQLKEDLRDKTCALHIDAWLQSSHVFACLRIPADSTRYQRDSKGVQWYTIFYNGAHSSSRCSTHWWFDLKFELNLYLFMFDYFLRHVLPFVCVPNHVAV